MSQYKYALVKICASDGFPDDGHAVVQIKYLQQIENNYFIMYLAPPYTGC